MLLLAAGIVALAVLAQLVSAAQLSRETPDVSTRSEDFYGDARTIHLGLPHRRRERARLHAVSRRPSAAGRKRDERAVADSSSTHAPTGRARASGSGTETKSGPRAPPTRATDQAAATTAPSFPSADGQLTPDTVSRLVPSQSVASMAASMSLATSGGPEASPVRSTSPSATPGNTAATSSASTARPLLQVMPGRHLSVFPIGLAVFGSVNGVALLVSRTLPLRPLRLPRLPRLSFGHIDECWFCQVTAYMYWERRAYARQFEERRREDKKGALLPTS